MSSNGVDYIDYIPQSSTFPRLPAYVPSEDEDDVDMRADEHFAYSDSDPYDRERPFSSLFDHDDEEEDDDEDDNDEDEDEDDSDRDHSEVDYGNSPLSRQSATASFRHVGPAEFTVDTNGYESDRDRSFYANDNEGGQTVGSGGGAGTCASTIATSAASTATYRDHN